MLYSREYPIHHKRENHKHLLLLYFQDTLRYEMVGTEQAMSYYYLNPGTGLITLKRLLTEGEQTQDDVSFTHLRN